MHIVVLVKQVPATDNVRMDPQTGTMIRSGKDNIMNPLDENALAEAVRIKETVPGVNVTAVSMGPESAGKVLREALALGADAAVLVTGRGLAGSDTIATARALAVAVAKAGAADLILCGERATDGETGQTGAMVAASLNLPVQTYVSRIDVTGGLVRVVRTVEDGFERVEVPFPVLVSVVKDINQPGFPTLDGKLRARSVPVTVWGAAELGLAPEETGLQGSPTRVVKIFSPRLTREGVLRKHDESAVGELLSFLADREAI